jgi:cytochrome P450
MTTGIAHVSPHLVTDFDVYDPTLAGEVDRFNDKIAELAAKGPVVYSTAYGGHWIVTGYQEIHTVLRDPHTYSAYPNNLVNAADGKFIPLELDPPEHTAFRHTLQPLFSPTRMRALETDIDSREFANPDTVQIDRSPNRHLTFSTGPHRCLGSHLARIEISIALAELHRRIPDYRVDPDKATISHASQVRGVLQLPILFTPEAQ